MSRIILIFIVSLLILLVAACSDGPEYHQDNLTGTWLWVSSFGGIAGVTITPESEGYDRYFGFHLRYKFTISQTNGLLKEGTYEIVKEEVNGEMADVLYLNSGSNELPMKISIVGDTLYLEDLCIDCFGHTYVRLGNI